jgi:DNA-directed RNA polymerase specialized sigma24 family protein
MNVDTQNFADLILRVRAGDTEAVEAVMTHYGEALQREVRFTLLDSRLRRFIGDSDVFQSVIFRFVNGMREGSYTVETPTDLLRLLKGIARNRIAELVRFWHAQRRDLSRNADYDAALTADPSDEAETPDHVLARAELASCIQERLEVGDCEIMLLRDEGLSWSAIAERLGAVSGEALRKRHTRAMAQIAAEFSQQVSDQ